MLNLIFLILVMQPLIHQRVVSLVSWWMVGQYYVSSHSLLMMLIILCTCVPEVQFIELYGFPEHKWKTCFDIFSPPYIICLSLTSLSFPFLLLFRLLHPHFILTYNVMYYYHGKPITCYKCGNIWTNWESNYVTVWSKLLVSVYVLEFP